MSIILLPWPRAVTTYTRLFPQSVEEQRDERELLPSYTLDLPGGFWKGANQENIVLLIPYRRKAMKRALDDGGKQTEFLESPVSAPIPFQTVF